MRHMYHTPNLTDLEKMRSDAKILADGDSRTAPTTVLLHHHKYVEACDHKNHERFEAKVRD